MYIIEIIKTITEGCCTHGKYPLPMSPNVQLKRQQSKKPKFYKVRVSVKTQSKWEMPRTISKPESRTLRVNWLEKASSWMWTVWRSESHSVLSHFFTTPWTVVPRLLCPWDSPGKDTGVGCHALIQGVFLTQESNRGLLHCRRILYQLGYRGSPKSVHSGGR